jgi:hypothetical protein
MDRNWSCFHLAAGASADGRSRFTEFVSTAVPRLRTELRAADNGGLWLFDRPRSAGETELLVRFWSSPPILERLRDQFAEAVAHADLVFAASNSLPASPLPLEFAQASSDLALDLARTVPPVPFTVMHLRELTELVPETKRTQFLFACWERWSAELTAAERVRVVEETATKARTVQSTADDLQLTGPAAESWLRYRDVVGRTSATASLPSTYLLFEYLHATHERMTIPAFAQCVAVLVVRTCPLVVAAGE